jgi:hypothetical protein
MLSIKKTGPDRIDIEFSGSLDADEMHAALDALISESADVTGGRMFYRIGAFEFPTLGALAVKFEYLPKLFALLGKYDRCAVVSDQAWIRTAADIEGALFPGIDIKGFEPAEEADAEAWLNEGREAA